MTGLKVIDGTPTAISKYLREREMKKINKLKKEIERNLCMKYILRIETEYKRRSDLRNILGDLIQEKFRDKEDKMKTKEIKEEGYYCKEWGCRKKGLDEFDGFCKEHKLNGEKEK